LEFSYFYGNNHNPHNSQAFIRVSPKSWHAFAEPQGSEQPTLKKTLIFVFPSPLSDYVFPLH